MDLCNSVVYFACILLWVIELFISFWLCLFGWLVVMIVLEFICFLLLVLFDDLLFGLRLICFGVLRLLVGLFWLALEFVGVWVDVVWVWSVRWVDSGCCMVVCFVVFESGGALRLFWLSWRWLVMFVVGDYLSFGEHVCCWLYCDVLYLSIGS